MKTNEMPPGTMERGYFDFLSDLKNRIRKAQVRASVFVNSELVILYWQIGQEILKQQKAKGWGAKIIDHIA